jgi:hypothetical protein
VSDLINPQGLIRLEDALHEAAAVPFLLAVALKGPTPIPSDPLATRVALNAGWAAKCLAAGVAGGYEGTDVLPLLKELLRTGDASMRACAATGLHWGKTLEGTDALIHALSDRDAQVRETCHSALADLTDKDLGDQESTWLAWWEQNKQNWPFNDRIPGTKGIPQKWVHPGPMFDPYGDSLIPKERRKESGLAPEEQKGSAFTREQRKAILDSIHRQLRDSPPER